MNRDLLVINTITFLHNIKNGELQETLISKINDLDVKNVEIRREMIKNFDRELKEIRRVSEKYNMKVLYSTPESLYVMGKFDKKGVSRYIDEAEQMGAKMIKLILGDYSGISSEDEVALKEILGKHDITLMVENDQSKAGGTLQRLLPFLNLCKEKEIKIFSTFDIGNWLWTGEDPLVNAMELEEFTKYIHLKDIIIENSVPNTTYLNEGSISWKEVLKIFSSDIPVALEYPCGAEAEKVLKEEMKKLF